MQSFWKLHRISMLLALGSVSLYFIFAYSLEREDFPKLVALFVVLFFLGFKLVTFEKWNFKFLLISGVLFRLVFLLATPNLSQDFYRFIWDGGLINHGINPYLYTPDELIQNTNVILSTVDASHLEELHSGMGNLSARHYSNYPPINQLFFALSTFLGVGSLLGSLVWMRLFIIAADLGILYYGKKLLENLNLRPHLIFWYFLNPLVIVELTGNLHFEGVMLFFFVWAIYLMEQGKYLFCAPIYAASIMLKLVPLLFLPLFLKYLGFKKSLFFYGLTIASCFLFLIPFYDPNLVTNYTKTISLWFSNFEFNAGFYNVVKTIAVDYFDEKPWKFIKTYGMLVKIVTLGLILVLTFFRKHDNLKSVILSMFMVLSCYYFISTTVHPWYICYLILLGLFTNYRFALLWSVLITTSYLTYSQPNFKESYPLLILQYLMLFGYLFYEMIKNHNIPGLIRKKS
mgnify:CR=1 FL=1